MEFYLSPAALAAIVFLDLLLGEFERLPHPVTLFGRVIARADGRFNRGDAPGGRRRRAGLLLAVLLPATVYLLTHLLIGAASLLGEAAGFMAAVLLGYTTISARGLRDAAMRVCDALERGDLPAARGLLARIVGRDTSGLDEPEIARGAVETVAENASDGVIAPLLYMLIGGVPLAMAYKAVNTLDSMIGYKNDRYRDFGRASARLDDALNYLPARLTALLMVAAAFLLRLDGKGAWRIMVRDGRNHPSPNAGWPEAAAAGALGVRLGGTNRYPGRTETRPSIGDPVRPLSRRHIGGAVSLMLGASLLMCLLSSALLAL